MSKGCPKCGSMEGYTYKDYGKTFEYVGNFGEAPEVVEIHDTKPAPKYCKCIDCGKRLKISSVRFE